MAKDLKLIYVSCSFRFGTDDHINLRRTARLIIVYFFYYLLLCSSDSPLLANVPGVPMIIMLSQVADYTRVFWRAELREGLQKL